MELKIKNVCCIGAGFVGGPTMAVMSKFCKEIIFNVVDINQKRIDDWNNEDLDKLPVYEPGLKEIVSKTRNENLFFSTNVKESIKNADMIFISVNTPTKKVGLVQEKLVILNGLRIAREVSSHAIGHTIVVEKSTLPVKTAEVIQKILNSANQNNKKKLQVLMFYQIQNSLQKEHH